MIERHFKQNKKEIRPKSPQHERGSLSTKFSHSDQNLLKVSKTLDRCISNILHKSSQSSLSTDVLLIRFILIQAS